jgi:hypothetical protein
MVTLVSLTCLFKDWPPDGGGALLGKDPDPDPYPDPEPVPNPDPLVRGMDPRIQIQIRIHTKMPWIRNTADLYIP